MLVNVKFHVEVKKKLKIGKKPTIICIGKMKTKGKTKKLRYIAPKAISLSGVAQGACTLGSTYQANRCKAGSSAGGRCEIGAHPDGGCKTGSVF